MRRYLNMKISYALLSAIALGLGCSKADQSSSTTSTSSDSAQAADSSGRPARITAVRGQLTAVTDTVLTVTTPTGDVSVKIVQPLEVYNRVPSKVSNVKPNSFVGVTSVPQSDGSLRATEIHIFPEKLRGMNEGSFPMNQRSGGSSGAGNTMTNGTVTESKMTNGTITGSGMTNGTLKAQFGGALSVRFKADSQTIAIPPDVSVTEITLTQTKLAPGVNVVIPATKQPDGSLTSSTVMLSSPRK